MQRQFLFLFLFMYQVSFHEPICCMRFAETVSLNLVSERFVPFSFFFFFFYIEDFQYTFFLPHTTVFQVIFNISWIIFNNIYETFTLYQREQSILIFCTSKSS